MVDKFSKEVRSRIMSKIKGKNTRPELLLRKALFKLGYRYGLNHRFKELNFKPDLVMVSRRICIFIDGCFWHGCPKCYKEPKSNKKYWLPKIRRNIERDWEQNRYLKKSGWSIIRVWEHKLVKNSQKTIKEISKKIRLIEMR